MLNEILKCFNTYNSFINNGFQRSTHPQWFFVIIPVNWNVFNAYLMHHLSDDTELISFLSAAPLHY